MNSSQASHEGWAWERPWGDRKVGGRKGGVTWLHKVVVMGPTAASRVEVVWTPSPVTQLRMMVVVWQGSGGGVGGCGSSGGESW